MLVFTTGKTILQNIHRFDVFVSLFWLHVGRAVKNKCWTRRHFNAKWSQIAEL